VAARCWGSDAAIRRSHISGRAPSRLAPFERYLRQLQAYLRGESVPFGDFDIPVSVAPPMEELELADAPAASRIGWIAEGAAKVPVEVAASGQRVISIAARHADRVMFALGADEERIAWGIAVARDARNDAGLDPNGISFGAYITCGCHTDFTTAESDSRLAHNTCEVLGDAWQCEWASVGSRSSSVI
jgi:5,10-methylenetetrahydromethanopterin reductase